MVVSGGHRVRFGNRLRDLVGAFAGVDAMSREWWADGPPDDVDAMALEAAREQVLGDPEANDAIAAKVRAEFETYINEICSGAWSVEGAQKIAADMCAAAEREIDRRARGILDGWAQDHAERAIDADEYMMEER